MGDGRGEHANHADLYAVLVVDGVGLKVGVDVFFTSIASIASLARLASLTRITSLTSIDDICS